MSDIIDKLKIIDQVLANTTIDELKHLLGPDFVVSKLREQESSDGTITTLIQDLAIARTEIYKLRNAYDALRNDLAELIRSTSSATINVVHDPVLYTLKTKYGVY